MKRAGRRLVADGPHGESPAERRHRSLAELRRAVRRHPAVEIVSGVRERGGRYRELDVEFDPLILGVDAETASLRIDWRPRPDPAEAAYFVFHYHDSAGRDFGWHREPNPHVDRLTHFQTRDSPEGEYEYAPTSPDPDSPVELLWELLGRIEDRVSAESR